MTSRQITKHAAPLLIIPILLLAVSHMSAGTLPGLAPSKQRFFPTTTAITSVTANPLTNQLELVGAVYPSTAIDFAGYCFVTSTGGASSVPSLGVYTGTGTGPVGGTGGVNLSPSADATLVYYYRITSVTSIRIYLTLMDAQKDTNPVVFLTAGSGPVQVSLNTLSNWCWNACTQMVLQYYGTPTSQDVIASTALSGSQDGRYYNVGNNLGNKRSGDSAAAYPGYTMKSGVGKILKDISNIPNRYIDTQLSKDQAQAEIDSKHPMIFQIGWYPPSAVVGRTGGHVFVAYGLDGDFLTIADPWPTYNVTVLSFSTLSSTGYFMGSPNNGIWEAELLTDKALDVLFLIDTTGSMGPYIANVRANLISLITQISSKFSDYRIAIADYKDYPPPDGTGSPGDYVYRPDLPFTTHSTDAQAAVNSLGATGGGDIPEAVYSALADGLSASGLGSWRSGQTTRVVIQIGDAPGHDPETFPGGTSSSIVLAKAADKNFPIRIFSIIPGFDLAAIAMGKLLAAQSGGTTANPTGSADVSGAISAAIATLADNPRTPSGQVAAIMPVFMLSDSKPGGMENLPRVTSLEVQKLNSASQWVTYDLETLSGNPQTQQLRSPLPIGTYRWRLDYTYTASIIASPTGEILSSILPHTSVETDFVQFDRLQALPQPPSVISPAPATGFVAQNAQINYTWNAGPNATSYSVQIFQDGLLWRTLTVQPPTGAPNAPTLQVAVAGHLVGHVYKWRVQSLNYDHPSPDATSWTPF